MRTRCRVATVLVTVALSFVLIGCSGQAGQRGDTAALGCNFDSARVCQSGMGQTMNYGNYLSSSSQDFMQQNGPSTTEFFLDFKAPSGTNVRVTCRENMSQRKIVYSSASPAGSLSDADKSWIQQSGLCVGQPTNGTPPPIQAQQ